MKGGSGFAAGAVLGMFAVGVGGALVSPAPPDVAPARAPVEAAEPAVSVAPPRCPPIPPRPSSPTPDDQAELAARVRALRVEEALLLGRLRLETGEELPPAGPNEAPEVVQAWLEEHAGTGELEIDCSKARCRGTVRWAVDLRSRTGANKEKDAMRSAILARYPGSALRDGISKGLDEMFVQFVISDTLESDAQRQRLERLLR